MRTTIPLVTCCKITDCFESATSESISTPRLIGPGCMMIASGFSHLTRSLLRPNMLVYSPSEGKCVELWRSCWIRSSITASASSKASRKSWQTLTPIASKAFGTKVLGPAIVTSAPSFCRQMILERATRLNSMSPRDCDLLAVQAAELL